MWHAIAYAQQDDLLEDDFKNGPAPGKRTFTSTCAGCHGLDGRGGERAPNIAGSARVKHLSDTQISGIISNGIAGTGMPAFHSLNPAQVRAVVSYLHLLQGKLAERALPGNEAAGKKIFFGKAECSSCHMISGVGGFLGPDLSVYGAELSAKAVLNAIIKPRKISQSGYRLAAVYTRDGSHMEGMVRNEDNFSVQLQSRDGAFHFFEKADLVSLEYLDQPLMPSDYTKQLSASELNDLVSYLMSATTSSKASTGSKPGAQ